jgi:hypothetical protein
MIVLPSLAANGELYPSLTEHENPARGLPSTNKDCTLRIGGSVFDGFKGLQGRGIEVAQAAVRPHLADKTAFADILSAW